MLSNLARALAALSGSRQIKSFSSFIPRKLMQRVFLGSLDFAVLRLTNLARQKQHQILAKQGETYGFTLSKDWKDIGYLK